MKSWQIPTLEQVDRAIALLAHPEQYRYFFDRLNNPKWIKPLKSKKYFCNPPKPEHDEERGTVQFPPWPESRYLARMASLEPETVLEVILQIPDNGNVRVSEDLIDAALEMPPELAARISEKAIAWVRLPYQLNLPEKLGALMTHLARGGKTNEAFQIARGVLEILPESRTDRVITEKIYRLPPKPRGRYQTWRYERILKEDYQELLKSSGVEALQLLCDLLETAIDLSRRQREGEDLEDYSYIWRPGIEDHPQNHPHGLNNVLVSAVRDAAVRLVTSKLASVRTLVLLFEKRSWYIFHRIALDLLRRFPDATFDLVAARLTDHRLFEKVGVRHEYALLLGECYGRMTEGQQQLILNWIETGPDLQEFKHAYEKATGKKPADGDISRYQRIWQRDHLAWFKEHLPEGWKIRYEAIVKEFGEPEHPEFSSYSESWVGPTSPKSTEELQSMPVTEIVEFLNTWKPLEMHMAPSPEGLGRMFISVVSQNPERFAIDAMRFQGLDPTYIRALFSGLRDGLKQNRAIEWGPVLELCRWVMDQPREIPGRKAEYSNLDPGWVWARKAIADLLGAGFEEGTRSIPFNQRHIVWDILYLLTGDPDPTPADEARYGGSNMDPATFSINTTRGETMHSVIRYALWVRNHLEKLPDGSEQLRQGFNNMSEVRRTLDEHLNIEQDPSLAIRAVYGQWLPWLILIDQEWVLERVPQIFPTPESERAFCCAAWDAYIVFCAAYDNVFNILHDQYITAIKHIGETKGDKRLLANPDERLAEHLMTFYWRGKLDLDDPDGLLSQFFNKASDELKAHALSFVGRALGEAKDSISPDILQRLKKLWENRLNAAKDVSTLGSKKSELDAFGWWFISKKFDEQWAIIQLVEALTVTRRTDPGHLVVERLAELVQEKPLETVQCLDAIVKGDEGGWGIEYWMASARAILAIALHDPRSRTTAEDLVNYLGKRGYFGFRDLLYN